MYCEPTNIPFYSTYGELFVDFRSDDSIHDIGFMGVYAVIGNG